MYCCLSGPRFIHQFDRNYAFSSAYTNRKYTRRRGFHHELVFEQQIYTTDKKFSIDKISHPKREKREKNSTEWNNVLSAAFILLLN